MTLCLLDVLARMKRLGLVKWINTLDSCLISLGAEVHYATLTQSKTWEEVIVQWITYLAELSIFLHIPTVRFSSYAIIANVSLILKVVFENS